MAFGYDGYNSDGNIDSKTEFFIQRKNEFVIPHKMEYRKSSTQYLYILRFNIKELLIVAKKSEATVLPVIVGIICRALHGVYDVGNNTIVGTCGVNLRQFYSSNTIKNFSQSVPIAFPARELKMSIEDQATCQRSMMDLCFQKENTDYSIACAYQRFLQRMNNAKIFDEIADQQKWDEIRKKEEVKSAYFLSYFGKVDLMKEAEPYLKDIFVYLPGTRSPLTMSALSYGDIMNISVTQSFESDEFVTQMKKCLEDINIDATLSYCGPQLFDRSIVTYADARAGKENPLVIV